MNSMGVNVLHHYRSMTHDFDIDNDEYYALVKAFAVHGFSEDKWVCEALQELQD